MRRFQSLDVVCRGSETQLQVSKKINKINKKWSNDHNKKGLYFYWIYYTMMLHNIFRGGDGILKRNPTNIRRWLNFGLLFGQRRRRWANSKPTLGQLLMFAGK